jgi:hypothetical protein
LLIIGVHGEQINAGVENETDRAHARMQFGGRHLPETVMMQDNELAVTSSINTK